MILAGGVGTRMRPLTYLMPKSMLPVGGMPLLERTIQYLKEYSFNDIVICVAYLKKQIMDYFRDGSSLGVRVEYAEADRPFGTAGQLKTAEKFISGTFLAMNGDIITSMNLTNLLDFHKKSRGMGTVALKKFEVRVPYGYVTVDSDSLITKFEEKPTLSFLANAGVYILEPTVFKYIQNDRVVSLETEIFPQIIQKEGLNGYFEEAYWADVGNMGDFERVDKELLSKYTE